MSPEEKLKGLLRLKRHETPPDGFFDNLLSDLHQRQRQELMNRGSLSILWERIGTWMDSLRRPAVIWSAAVGYAAIMMLVVFWPKPSRTPGGSVTLIAADPSVMQPQPQNAQPRPPAPPPFQGAIPVSNAPLLPTGTKQKDANDPIPQDPVAPPIPKSTIKDL